MSALVFCLLVGTVQAAERRLPQPPPPEPPAERAARLWQAGVFSLQRGDYSWAKKQFEECLKADPASEDCKKGAAEAADQAALNPKPVKKAKPKKAKPAPPRDEDAPAEDGGK